MKHLRKFNESVEGKEELQDFCETYLAYLLDKGFLVIVYELQFCYKITIYKPHHLLNYPIGFKWEDISDSFIPFVKFLYKDYNSYGNKCIHLFSSEPKYGETRVYVFKTDSKIGDQWLVDHELDIEKLNNIPVKYKRMLDESNLEKIEIQIKK